MLVTYLAEVYSYTPVTKVSGVLYNAYLYRFTPWRFTHCMHVDLMAPHPQTARTCSQNAHVRPRARCHHVYRSEWPLHTAGSQVLYEVRSPSALGLAGLYTTQHSLPCFTYKAHTCNY